jgi:putative nucleotidyltransferase with HDIG domain
VADRQVMREALARGVGPGGAALAVVPEPEGGDAGRDARLEALLTQLENLPSHPTASSRVLWVADDPNASAADLAAAVSADPALTARAMRMANSAYYGLSGRVSSATFAVTVLGFATVRSLAVATSAGVMGEDAYVPPGFWDHAAATACAASLVADRVRAPRPEAFSVGLLHDLGEALLYRADPGRTGAAHDEAGRDSPEAVLAEREVLGIDHAAAAARVLGAWKFPPVFVAAIADHHSVESRNPSPLHKALVAGHAVAKVAAAADKVDLRNALAEGRDALALANIDDELAESLGTQVKRQAAEVAGSLVM